MSEKNLLNFRYDVYSQNGEDGIIQEIFERLPNKSEKERWAVEFGAWDGMFLSNTFNLLKKGWKAIYIEGDPKRFEILQDTAKKYNSIIPINAFVTVDKSNKNSLNNLLVKHNIPLDFDILSIDIDSFDLEIWQSFEEYKPKLVIIEINSKYLPGIFKWHSKNDSPKESGNSFSATLQVAINKGYKLVCHTGNMFFVRGDLVKYLNIEEKLLTYPELLYQNEWYLLSKENFILQFIRLIFSSFKSRYEKLFGRKTSYENK